MRWLLGAAFLFLGATLACSEQETAGAAGAPGEASGGSSAACKSREARAGVPVLEEGCVCGEAAQGSSLPPYPAKCRGESLSTGTNTSALCCQSNDSCTCRPVGCGISNITNRCYCGVAPVITSEYLSGCNATGSRCCRSNKGDYCTCHDDEACDPGTSEVTTCDVQSLTPTCQGADQSKVEGCE